MISAHRHGLAEHFVRLRKAHRQNRHFCAVLVLQLQRCLKACLVVRIHDCEHCSSVQRSVGIEHDAALGIGYLFYTDNDFH